MTRPGWTEEAPAITSTEILERLDQRGVLDEAAEVFAALDRGELPVGYSEVDLDELRRRYG